jgi:hypothetical protein
VVSGAGFFGHLPQYGQMRCRLSVGRYLSNVWFIPAHW